MTIQTKKYIKENIPYYGKIGPSKGRYKGIKGKAWDILSDYVRMRDWLRYKTSVSSGVRIEHWRDGDAGHYYSMSGHGAYLGFYELNIHLQGSMENKIGSAHSGAYYQQELVRRYGTKLLLDLAKYKNETVKADDWYFLERIEYIYGLFQELKKEYPNADYPKYI